MRVERIHGALYGECWPSGARATSPPHLRFLRVSRGGQTAAQDDAGRIVALDGRVLHPTSCGVSPVIWQGEELWVNVSVPGGGCRYGSQGFRYWRSDGSIATGDETYKHPTLPLWEYTDLGDGLLVGQGEDGAEVWDGSVMRMLEPGHCTFIRANREGDQVGIAIAKQQDGPSCVLIDATVAELRALPLVGAPPPPEPPPVEPPRPPMPDIPNQFDVVKHVRSAYPTPLGAAHGPFLLELARMIGRGAGLLRKDAGVHIVLPDGTRVAQDIICFPDGRIFDVLGDGEGAATPQWGEANGSPVDVSRYYAVAAGPVQPPVKPPPPPPPDELAQLKHYVVGLVQLLESYSAEQREQQVKLTAMSEKVAELLTWKATANTRFAEAVKKLRVKGSTSRSYGHSHSVDLSVVSE